ncbi:hypothetical protein E3N88_18224 [Mikania micrantha]|uniref:Uncharacterized protein n=1 Tax=Mikania micrantha TaxID=192012 RepID=A0A5N6NWT6_9ASTR|nr:hypothetical protein E3N88_18224 [Mikania micrantha]
MYRAEQGDTSKEFDYNRRDIGRRCPIKEREGWLRANNPDFTPVPRIFDGAFEFTEPRALYRHYQIKANKTPISIDESSIYSDIARQVERQTTRKVVKAMRSLQAVLDFKAQVCSSKSSKDNHWGNHWPEIHNTPPTKPPLMSTSEAKA